MSKVDLGSVSAFDIAVKNGYAGTEADWVNDIANASEYSNNANESAQAAEASAGQAAVSAEEARIKYGSPLVAAIASAMTDTNRVYVYTGNETGYTTGNWYYHNGTAWVSGGVYNGNGVNTDDTLSIEGMPADAKAVGTLIGDIDDLETVDKTDLVSAINEASKSGGGGITETQKELIVTILRNALYSSDQSENIDALEEAFDNPVSYITASIYLHGNTIYTDDTLDTLRQYLTVVAYFEDGTNQAVTGYSLSGTLTAGTSVITINYRDATTTVNVPVSQAVTRYTITNNLTGVTNSNTDVTIPEGNTYTGVLSADTAGYVPTGVIVTVGGTDVTSTVYNSTTYTITIPSVDGDITITASEVIEPPTPVYRGQNLVFDGTKSTVIDTGIKLCDTDKDFTIVLKVDTPTGSTLSSGAHLICCLAGSNGYDGYFIARAESTKLAAMAYVNSGGTVDFSDTYNALNDRTQVIIMRHESGSGKITASAYIYRNGAVSVGTLTQNFTFSAHDNTLIIGARRWNGINGAITGTVKQVDVFLQYLSDDQVAIYYE